MNTELAETIHHIKKQSGSDLEKLKDYMSKRHLLIFLLSKKYVGKSVYSAHLLELFPNEFVNVSFGETIRHLKEELKEDQQALINKWGQETASDLGTCSVAKLLSLISVKKVFDYLINSLPSHKSILLDGLPREKEQIPIVIEKSRTLSKRGYEVIFLEIDLADEILDARVAARRVCPQCQYSGNILTPTVERVSYDPQKQTFHLLCPKCGVPLEIKKGDHLNQGSQLTQAVRQRREKFKKMVILLRSQLPPKQYIFLRTDIPCDEFNGKEIELNLVTKYSTNSKGEVIIKRTPQTATHNGKTVYSLAPAGAVIRIVKKLAEVVSE